MAARTFYGNRRQHRPILQRPASAARFDAIMANFIIDNSSAISRANASSVFNGICDFCSVFRDEDLVQIRMFNRTLQTLTAFCPEDKINWSRIDSKLEFARGGPTALFDAIVQSIDEYPRDGKFKRHWKELIVFSAGFDNCSRDLGLLAEKIRAPDCKMRITIIDAADNSMLKRFCTGLEHCTYVSIRATDNAISKAFEDTCGQMLHRFELTSSLAENAPPPPRRAEAILAQEFHGLRVDQRRPAPPNRRPGRLSASQSVQDVRPPQRRLPRQPATQRRALDYLSALAATLGPQVELQPNYPLGATASVPKDPKPKAEKEGVKKNKSVENEENKAFVTGIPACADLTDVIECFKPWDLVKIERHGRNRNGTQFAILVFPDSDKSYQVLQEGNMKKLKLRGSILNVDIFRP